VLPVLFIVLASAALFAALVALFVSLRASLAGPTGASSWSSGEPDRGALEDEKNALLRALKDLEYEHEVGKIDDEDYARLERAYRARAKDVLVELDRDLSPYLSRAEALAGSGSADYRQPDPAKKKKKKKKGEVESESKPESEGEGESTHESKSTPASKSELEGKSEPESDGESESEPEPALEPAKLTPPVCPKCSTVNDVDASFCKKCATPLTATETP